MLLLPLTEVSARDLALLRNSGIISADEIALRDASCRFFAVCPTSSNEPRPINVEGLLLESNRRLLKD